MGDLQSRIGPKVTRAKLYPNLTWKRESPSKDTLKSTQTQAHQSDEKEDASSHELASSVFSSPSKSSYQSTSSPRPRKSSGELSLLSRMGLSTGGSHDDRLVSEGNEAAGIQHPSLLSRVGTTEDETPQPSIQEQDFEDGELVDSEPLPPQQVRDFLLPLVMKNAAHRLKEGDSELTRPIAQSILSDEVCSSFMHQMKEVRSEMHAHKNRSSNTPEMQLMEKTNNLGAADTHTVPSSKIGQTPPSGPRAMTRSTTAGKEMPPNAEIATVSNRSKDQPISALSNHSHDLVSSQKFERHELGFRHNPSPERKGFHDQDRGSRYSQHREKFGDYRSRSRSPSRYSLGQPYNRPSDSSRHMVRSPPPHVTSPGRRRSPPGPSQSTFFRDRAPRESPEAISGGRSASPSGTSNHNGRRSSLSRDFKRPKNISPHWDDWDETDSPRSPVSHRHFDRRRADKVVSPHRPSITHERGREFPRRGKVSIPRSGSITRRSVSPRRKQYRRLSAERPLRRTPPPYSQRSATPNPYYEVERHRTPPPHLQRPATPNPYYGPERRSGPRSLTPFELDRRRDLGADYMESVNPGAGSMSTQLTIRATGSHHPTPEPMVAENKDMRERVNNRVRTPKRSDDMQESRPAVLPCHNVPGVWFVKVASGDIGTLECSFEVDDVTALKWNLGRAK